MTNWPEHDHNTSLALIAATFSRRWAIASPPGLWPRRVGIAEHGLASLFKCKYAVTVCNGSAALVLAMQAVGVGPGSKVAVPILTWVGCITSILRLGATPVLIDSSSESLGMDNSKINEAGIDAVLAIPLYAGNVDIDELRKSCPKAKIILDLSHVSCSPSLHPAVEKADIVASSLQASKVLTCGEGGFVGVNDLETAKRLQALRSDGRVFDGKPESGHSIVVPGNIGHGANYAMSEITAALLIDQMGRLAEQAGRRAIGGATLIDAMKNYGTEYYADDTCLLSGLHYGMPVKVDLDPELMIRKVQKELGIKLDRCYPPLHKGPLYSPETERRYNNLRISSDNFQNAQYWHDNLVIVPHQAFLLPEKNLKSLALHLSNNSISKASDMGAIKKPDVSVVIITKGKPTLNRALASIMDQSYEGLIKPIVIIDEVAVTDVDKLNIDSTLNGDVISIKLSPDLSVIERVSSLRDMALRLVNTPLVCFLDDDNYWEKDHIRCLQETIEQTQTGAAYSWRIVHMNSSKPWHGKYFPWLEQGTERERLQYQACLRQGIINKDSNVVRDTAFAMDGDKDISMVDLGEWLFDARLICNIGIHSNPMDNNQDVNGLGEDDILLQTLKANHIPLVCSRVPTLNYFLGGFSNSYDEKDSVWERTRGN